MVLAHRDTVNSWWSTREKQPVQFDTPTAPYETTNSFFSCVNVGDCVRTHRVLFVSFCWLYWRRDACFSNLARISWKPFLETKFNGDSAHGL